MEWLYDLKENILGFLNRLKGSKPARLFPIFYVRRSLWRRAALGIGPDSTHLLGYSTPGKYVKECRECELFEG